MAKVTNEDRNRRIILVTECRAKLTEAADILERDNPVPLGIVRDIRRIIHECNEEIGYLNELNEKGAP